MIRKYFSSFFECANACASIMHWLKYTTGVLQAPILKYLQTLGPEMKHLCQEHSGTIFFCNSSKNYNSPISVKISRFEFNQTKS